MLFPFVASLTRKVEDDMGLTEKEKNEIADLVIRKWRDSIMKEYPPDEYGSRGLRKLRSTAAGWLLFVLFSIIVVMAGVNMKSIIRWFIAFVGVPT